VIVGCGLMGMSFRRKLMIMMKDSGEESWLEAGQG
jgi:hypothetical protein